MEDARIGEGASVGPFARLRPGADLAKNSHIGNFVEIKQSEIAEGAKVNHLTYIGEYERRRPRQYRRRHRHLQL